MDINVRYADTKRPAIGLTAESWAGDTLVASKVTDRFGLATGLEQGLVLKLRRGSYYFSYPEEPLVPGPSGTAVIDLQPEHWPAVLKELRQKLGEQSRWSRMARAANQVLKALQHEGTLRLLTNPELVNERPLADNPHIHIGALVTSLCITRLYRGYGPLDPAGMILDSQSDEMWAIDSALQGLFHWLEHREGVAGYFCRWGEPDAGSLINSYEKFETHWKAEYWKAEPSLDEYSGLLLGLRWATVLGTPEISQAANNWLSHISEYLTETKGWLVTRTRLSWVQLPPITIPAPLPYPPIYDYPYALVVRGPDILANAFPLRCILPNYSLQHPLRPVLDSLYIDAARVETERAAWLQLQYPSETDEFLQKYAENLKIILQVQKTMDDIDFWEDVVTFVATIVLGPVGLALGLIGIYYLNQAIGKVVNVTDEQLWTYCAKALGKPITVDSGGYNSAIFDRYSLAASWSPPIQVPQQAPDISRPLQDAFNIRATRPIDSDRLGWQLLGIGSRIWFGSDLSVDDIVETFDINVLRKVPPPVAPSEVEKLPNPIPEQVEGFVLGWAITCLALDLDPGIEWASCIDQRFAQVAPPATSLERFSARVEEVTLTAAKEPIEEPYALAYQIVVDSVEGQITMYVNDAYRSIAHGYGSVLFSPDSFRQFYSSGRKKINKPARGMVLNETLKVAWDLPIYKYNCFTLSGGKWTQNGWDIPSLPRLIHGRRDYMVVLTAWEHDFTTKAKVQDAAAKTQIEIAHILRNYLSPGYVIELVAEHLQYYLHDWLLSLYPERLIEHHRRDGVHYFTRFNDDDLIGVQVITLSPNAETAHLSKDFHVVLSRAPQSAMRFKGSIQYGSACRFMITDDWSSGSIDPLKWRNWGSPQTSVVNDQLQIASVLGSGYFGLESHWVAGVPQPLAGLCVTNKLVSAGDQSLASWAVYPITIRGGRGEEITDGRIYFRVSNNKVYAGIRFAGGVSTDIRAAPYDSSTHLYFRVRVFGVAIYYETSVDGSTWTNFASTTGPFDITYGIGMEAGTWYREASTTTAIFDDWTELHKDYKRAYRFMVTDDWSSESIDPLKWRNWGNPQTSVVDDQLQIASVLESGYFGLESHWVAGVPQSLAGLCVTNKLVSAGDQSLASWAVYPITIRGGMTTRGGEIVGDRIFFRVSNNMVYASIGVAGVSTDIRTAPYNSSTHLYFRVKVSRLEGVIYYETSANGSTWTNFASWASPFDITYGIGMEAGTGNREASTTTATFDDWTEIREDWVPLGI